MAGLTVQIPVSLLSYLKEVSQDTQHLALQCANGKKTSAAVSRREDYLRLELSDAQGCLTTSKDGQLEYLVTSHEMISTKSGADNASRSPPPVENKNKPPVTSLSPVKENPNSRCLLVRTKDGGIRKVHIVKTGPPKVMQENQESDNNTQSSAKNSTINVNAELQKIRNSSRTAPKMISGSDEKSDTPAAKGTKRPQYDEDDVKNMSATSSKRKLISKESDSISGKVKPHLIKVTVDPSTLLEKRDNSNSKESTHNINTNQKQSVQDKPIQSRETLKNRESIEMVQSAGLEKETGKEICIDSKTRNNALKADSIVSTTDGSIDTSQDSNPLQEPNIIVLQNESTKSPSKIVVSPKLIAKSSLQREAEIKAKFIKMPTATKQKTTMVSSNTALSPTSSFNVNQSRKVNEAIYETENDTTRNETISPQRDQETELMQVGDKDTTIAKDDKQDPQSMQIEVMTDSGQTVMYDVIYEVEPSTRAVKDDTGKVEFKEEAVENTKKSMENAEEAVGNMEEEAVEYTEDEARFEGEIYEPEYRDLEEESEEDEYGTPVDYDNSKEGESSAAGVPLICFVCARVFSSEGRLKQHLAKHERQNGYMCELCGRSFKAKNTFLEHVQCVHEKRYKYTCDKCGYGTMKRSLLGTHTCWKIINRGPKKCEVCKKVFPSTAALDAHMVDHTGVRNFVCHVCGDRFKNKNTLQYHVLCTHQQKYRYTCQKCGHGVSKRSQLAAHICGRIKRRIRIVDLDGVREAKENRKRGDPKQEKLLEHYNEVLEERKRNPAFILVKTPDGLFGCLLCFATFKATQGLADHEVRVHASDPAVNIPQYKCAICHKHFVYETSLLQHMQMHTGKRDHLCELCGASLSSTASLYNHMRTVHKQMHRYQCDYCGRGFHSRINLNKHDCGRLLDSAYLAEKRLASTPAKKPAKQRRRAEKEDTNYSQALLSTILDKQHHSPVDSPASTTVHYAEDGTRYTESPVHYVGLQYTGGENTSNTTESQEYVFIPAQDGQVESMVVESYAGGNEVEEYKGDMQEDGQYIIVTDHDENVYEKPVYQSETSQGQPRKFVLSDDVTGAGKSEIVFEVRHMSSETSEAVEEIETQSGQERVEHVMEEIVLEQEIPLKQETHVV